jgi:hypothetical protein
MGEDSEMKRTHTPQDVEKIQNRWKKLTDDEIEEFAYAFELWQLNNPDKALEGIKDFARAILRKAQEK